MGSVEEVRPSGTPISSSTLLVTRHTYEGYTDLHADSWERFTWPLQAPDDSRESARKALYSPQSLHIYIRTSLRGQFMYLTVSMRLTNLGGYFASDQLDLTRSQLIVDAFPPCALLCVAVLPAKPSFLGGGFRTTRSTVS